MINKAVDQAIENKQLAPKSYVDVKIAEALAKLQQDGTQPSKPQGPGEQPQNPGPSQPKTSYIIMIVLRVLRQAVFSTLLVIPLRWTFGRTALLKKLKNLARLNIISQGLLLA
nr:MAG TPA: hypothetical protein [Caudoviricetes sp.]